jgi:hypothetical protein
MLMTTGTLDGGGTKKEQLSIQQGTLAREVALAEKELKKKGAGELKKLDDRLSKLQKSNGVATRVPEHGYHSQIVQRPDSVKWVQVDLGKRQKIKSVLLHACYDDFAGIGASILSRAETFLPFARFSKFSSRILSSANAKI